MPAGVPPYIMRTFKALVPFMLTLPIVWAVSWTVYANFGITIPQAVLNIFQPLVVASNSYPAALGMILVMLILWSMGIHGMNVVSSVAYPFWMSQLAQNADAVSAGQEATGIVTEPFFSYVYSHRRFWSYFRFSNLYVILCFKADKASRKNRYHTSNI